MCKFLKEFIFGYDLSKAPEWSLMTHYAMDYVGGKIYKQKIWVNMNS